jgi:hypothetical protein
MVCPECGAEYRPGFTRCSDCDVDLVAALPTETAPQEVGVHDLSSPSILRQGLSAADAPALRDALNAAGIRFNTRRSSAEIIADGSPTYEFWINSEDRANAQSVLTSALHADETGESPGSLQVVWGGADRGMFDRRCSALDDEGIAYFKYEPLEARLGAGFRRNPLEVSVEDADYAAALDVLASINGDSNSGVSIGAGSSPSGTESSRRGAEDDAPDLAPDDLPVEGQDIDDDELTSEAWSGAAADQADVLKLCLREVGIASRVAKAASGVRLLVAEKDVARSRGIIREVIEAAPSE